MSKSSRSGFTLAELLVVIVIIAILVGLMLPAILAARGRARTNQCMNHQAEISKAIGIYESSKDHYPGYVNPKNISWIVAILEPLGEVSLWKEWRDDGTGPPKRIRQLVCPTDVEAQGDSPCSYVGNCGEPGVDLAPKATGIFHDRSAGYGAVTVSSSDIKDGAQHTLLISERRTSEAEPAYEGHQWSDFLEEKVGFTWIKEQPFEDPVGEHIWSNHPGVIVVSFCDGHQQQLKKDVSYGVYRLLMTPDGPAVDQNEVLEDGDY